MRVPTLGGHTFTWEDDWTPDVKLEELKRRKHILQELGVDRHNCAIKTLGDAQSEVSEIRAGVALVRREIEEAERQAIEINAGALPLIALGIVLTGIPDVTLAWVWLWVLVVAELCVVTHVFWRIQAADSGRQVVNPSSIYMTKVSSNSLDALDVIVAPGWPWMATAPPAMPRRR